MPNILSFDIEEWFHPEIFHGRFSSREWDKLESRVVGNTERILNFLEGKRLEATFFILGWVAEKYPHLVEQIDRAGHEIASHGFSHDMITRLNPEQFRKEIRRSLQILNSLSSNPVIGFRAPTFSITRQTLWALPILLEEGIRYDSSVYPIVHDRYGIPDAPTEPYVIYQNQAARLWEFPMSVVRIAGWNLPLGGGGYLRLYPKTLTSLLLTIARRQNRQLIVYAHPWEIDPETPQVSLNVLGRFRHYHNLEKFLDRLDWITDVVKFTSFRQAYRQVEMAETSVV
ncbi:MAG: DUF3473 domain-containing protein [Calditrichaeota bacterium]|nr:MAG: DUF3473 domain-containing protein [Calditrichota bacterium]